MSYFHPVSESLHETLKEEEYKRQHPELYADHPYQQQQQEEEKGQREHEEKDQHYTKNRSKENVKESEKESPLKRSAQISSTLWTPPESRSTSPDHFKRSKKMDEAKEDIIQKQTSQNDSPQNVYIEKNSNEMKSTQKSSSQDNSSTSSSSSSGSTLTIVSKIIIHSNPEQIWKTLLDLNNYEIWNPHFVKASGDVKIGNKLELKVRRASNIPGNLIFFSFNY